MGVDPNEIIIHAELRDEPDVAALAAALLDILPTLDQETLDRLAVAGAELKRQLDQVEDDGESAA